MQEPHRQLSETQICRMFKQSSSRSNISAERSEYSSSNIISPVLHENSLNYTKTSREEQNKQNNNRRLDQQFPIRDTTLEPSKRSRRLDSERAVMIESARSYAHEELRKCSDNLPYLTARSEGVLSMFAKVQDFLGSCSEVFSAKNNAFHDIHAVKNELKKLQHRSQNAPEANDSHSLASASRYRRELDSLKIQCQRLNNDNQDKSKELDAYKNLVPQLNDQISLLEDAICRKESEAVMQNMLQRIQLQQQIQKTALLQSEKRQFSQRINDLQDQIEKSRLQKTSLFDKSKSLEQKTRTLEERLKNSQNSCKSKSMSETKIVFDGFMQSSSINFPADPTSRDLGVWASLFGQYAKLYRDKSKSQKQNDRSNELKDLHNSFQKICEILDVIRLRKATKEDQKSPSKETVPMIILRSSDHNDLYERNRLLEKQLDRLRNDIKAYKNQNNNLKQLIKDMQERLIIKEDQSNDYIFDRQEEEYMKQIEEMTAKLHKYKSVAERHRMEVKFLKEELAKQNGQSFRVQNQLLHQRNELELRAKDLQFHLDKERCERRRLHNEVEDLKGNIRVYCRIRPLSRLQLQKKCHQVIEASFDTVSLTTKNKMFAYDAVFSERASQEQVFQETKKLVKSAIDGYNCCIFAYGQTGSGKTYTLHGTKENPGIAPRVIAEVYRIINQMKHHYTVRVDTNMLEIYMDNLIDLYQPKNKKQLEIREDNRWIFVDNSCNILVNSQDEIQKVYKTALEKRKVSPTELNSQSSRSHLVFMIFFEIQNNQTKQKKYGKISLVDLAGSEKPSKNCNNNIQFKESASINKALAALSDVIAALQEKGTKDNRHIPYRNHKLTHLLKDSLGGKSKTLMFVNLSPAEINIEETCVSLSFANRIKNAQRSSVSGPRERLSTEEDEKRRSVSRNIDRKQCRE